MDDYLSSAEAAQKLGVNDSRIRQLARAGRLASRKIGNRWLFSRDAINRAQARPVGRPLSPSSAWALLLLASGEQPRLVEARSERRLKKRLRSLHEDADRLAVRAKPYWFQADLRALSALRNDPGFVRSGVSVSEEYAIDIRAPSVLEGYYPQRELDRFSYRYALRPVSEESANLIIHAVRGRFPLAGRRLAPVAVAAVDLLESQDERSRRAGAKLLRGLVAP